jgi:glycosyltransferase involved in cell wall biosynthesis
VKVSIALALPPEMTQDTKASPSTKSAISSLKDLIFAAKSLSSSQDYEGALALLEAAPPEMRRSEMASRLARHCYGRLGELSLALGEVNRSRRGRQEDALDRQARMLLGKIRETDPTWLPPVPPLESPPQPEPGVVLHLLKESLPYSESGYTFRSRMTIATHRLAGWRPVVITSLGFPRYKGIVGFPLLESVDGVEHHRLDTSPELPSVKDWPVDIVLSDQARLTAQLADDLRPSVVQAASGFRGFDQALVGLAVARRARVPFVYEVRGFLEQTWTNDVERSEKGEYFRLRRRQEQRCLVAADRVVTIADSMRDEIISRGVDPEKVHVVPNVVDVERFTSRPKRLDLIDSMGLSDRLVLGYVSNISWREGLSDLIRALRLLVDQRQSVTCLIVGEGPERQSLVKLAKDLGLSKEVHFTGHVPNERILDYYSLIDVFVVPRINDRASRLVTPLKPLEAMSMRIPVVASDLPALRELVAPGKRGLVFNPGEPSSLAAVLTTMIEDEGLRSDLAENAHQWVTNERTLESNVARYQEALAGLV